MALEDEDPETVFKLTQEMVLKVERAHFLELVMKPDSAFHLVGLDAARAASPRSPGPMSRLLGHTFIDGAREYFADYPTILDVIRRGDDPDEDR